MEALPKMDYESWRDRAIDEVGFWSKWISTGGHKWPQDFERRIDPTRPLAPLASDFLKKLDFPEGQTVRILDIGAGPISFVEGRHERHPIDLTVVDPLADEYNELLDAAGIDGPTRPMSGSFEGALAQFGAEKFDLVWCFNSLDHSMDPLLGLFNLLTLCRMGGGLILGFHPNEADGGNYKGLHQWNLDRDGKRIHLSQRDRSIDLTPLLEQQDIVSIWQRAEREAGVKGLVVLQVRKTTACNLSQAFLR